MYCWRPIRKTSPPPYHPLSPPPSPTPQYHTLPLPLTISPSLPSPLPHASVSHPPSPPSPYHPLSPLSLPHSSASLPLTFSLEVGTELEHLANDALGHGAGREGFAHNLHLELSRRLRALTELTVEKHLNGQRSKRKRRGGV